MVLLAYAMWGLLPAFWHLLSSRPAEQVLAQRVLWSIVLLGVFFTVSKRWPSVAAVVRSRAMGWLMLSSALLGVNWYVYIAAIQHGRLGEASLGYFICPLLSIALGRIVFGERLGSLRVLALCMVGCGVAYRGVAVGAWPWLAFAIAGSFAFYSLIRKRCQVDPWAGFFLETSMLLPAVLGIAARQMPLNGPFFYGDSARLLLLFIASGLVTTVPMVLLAAGVPRVSMQFLGAGQYLNPTLSLMLATFAYGEPVRAADMVSFPIIWAGILLFVAAPAIAARRINSLAGRRPFVLGASMITSGKTARSEAMSSHKKMERVWGNRAIVAPPPADRPEGRRVTFPQR